MTDWPWARLSELVSVKHGFAFSGDHFRDEPPGDVLLTPGNFAAGGGFKGDKLKYYSGPVPAEFVLEPGALLVTMTDLSRGGDTLGFPAWAPDLPKVRVLHNQRIGRVMQILPGRVDLGFIYYALCSRSYRDEVLASATGSTVRHTSPSRICAHSLQLPSLREQEAIAALLGGLDAKIELNRRMNETLELMARALFKSWFIDFDPVRAKAADRVPFGIPADVAARLPSSFAGDLPVGWRVLPLAEIAAAGGGGVQTGPFGSQLHASDYINDGIPVVMPTNIRHRRVERDGIVCVSMNDAERLSRHRLAAGDLVYSRRGDVEKHALIGTEEVGWLCGTGCLRVRLSANGNTGLSHFISLALDQPESRAWIAARAVGATMPNLNTAILGDIPLVRPTSDVIDAFGEFLAPIDARVRCARAESKTLEDMREALLPKLLSGELRLRDAEKAVEAAS